MTLIARIGLMLPSYVLSIGVSYIRQISAYAPLRRRLLALYKSLQLSSLYYAADENISCFPRSSNSVGNCYDSAVGECLLVFLAVTEFCSYFDVTANNTIVLSIWKM